MKTSSKIFSVIFLLSILFVNQYAKAQTVSNNPWRLGFGVEGGIPTGDLNGYSHFELGGTARLQYDLTRNFSLMLTSGFYNFFSHEQATINGTVYPAVSDNLGLVPVKAGAKIFFAGNLYADGEVGAGFETSATKNTKLILSPGIGWANHQWDIGLRYENFSGQANNYGTVALRLAYGFNL